MKDQHGKEYSRQRLQVTADGNGLGLQPAQRGKIQTASQAGVDDTEPQYRQDIQTCRKHKTVLSEKGINRHHNESRR